MLLFPGFQVSNLVCHDVENVLSLSFPVEDGACQLIRVFNVLGQDSLLSFQDGPVLIAYLNGRLHHFSADHLNARFDIKPVELMNFVLC